MLNGSQEKTFSKLSNQFRYQNSIRLDMNEDLRCDGSTVSVLSSQPFSL